MTDKVERASAWTHYWTSGPLHSLPGSFEANYSGTIRAFWERQFAALSAEDHVLDIGTGNGALPQLLLDTAPQGLPAVDAIDLAQIRPQLTATHSAAHRVRFHGNVQVESLPFASEAFTLVVSQYGFEYSNRAVALKEISRVLAPGARLVLLMHHAQSRLAEVAGHEVASIEWLLRPGGFLECALQAYPFTAAAGSPERESLKSNPAAAAARQALNDAVRTLTSRAESAAVPDSLLEARSFVAHMLDAALKRGDAAASVQQHTAYCSQLREAAFRSAELLEHALDEDEIRSLCEVAETVGLRPDTPEPIHHENGALMGWTLLAQRL